MFGSLLGKGVFHAVSRARIYLATIGACLLLCPPCVHAHESVSAFAFNKCTQRVEHAVKSSLSSFCQALPRPATLHALVDGSFSQETQNIIPVPKAPRILKMTPERRMEIISAYLMHNMLVFSCKVTGKGCEQVASYALYARSFDNKVLNDEASYNKGFTSEYRGDLYASLNHTKRAVTAQEDIYIGPLELEGYNEYIAHTLVPFSFGQQYIGRITAKQYGQAWKEYIDSLNSSRPNQADKKCYLSAAGSNLSVFGYNCMPFKGFERMEASADQHGTLSSVTIYHKLNKSTADIDTFLNFLDSRYQRIDPAQYGLQELANLKQDLVRLMKILSHDQYVNQFYWHLFDGNKFLSVNFVTVRGNKLISVIFASKSYLQNEERLATLRRLALVRQELNAQGIDSDSLMVVEEAPEN